MLSFVVVAHVGFMVLINDKKKKNVYKVSVSECLKNMKEI